MNKLVQVSSLWKSFGSNLALKDISFFLNEGEILGVLGANGAGKSTLIHCMLGLCSFDKGSISYFDGLSMPGDRKKILNRINFASTYTSLPYSLTVQENLIIFGNLYGLKGLSSKIDRVLELFSISDLKYKPLRKLSSGQMMRVNLAKAMLNDPRVLLLDEPTSGLDPEMADRTRKLLKNRCKEQSMSILYTSHNLTEIEEIADSILILNKGNIVAFGNKEKLLEGHGISNLKELYFSFVK